MRRPYLLRRRKGIWYVYRFWDAPKGIQIGPHLFSSKSSDVVMEKLYRHLERITEEAKK